MRKSYKSHRVASISFATLLFFSIFLFLAHDSASAASASNIEVVNIENSTALHGTGYIHVDKKVGSIDTKDIPGLFKASTEAKYIPDISSLPDVRDQGDYGLCWAFSTVGLAEFSILKNENKSIDLSELQLAYYSFHTAKDPLGLTVGDKNQTPNPDNYLDIGGNLIFSTKVLWNWNGMVSEDETPYSYASKMLSRGLPEQYSYYCNSAHLRNAYYIDIKNNPTIVKNMVKQFGSVSISYYAGGRYNSTNNCQYESNSSYKPNHSVNIVGWDDTFSASKFNPKAPGNGAWLIRNSWGSSDYSINGYFWLSYYDNTIYPTAYAIDAVSSSNSEYYDNNYQYDGSSASGSYIYSNSSSIKVANVFKTHNTNEILKAVSFETANTNLSYTIKIYKNLKKLNNPTSGTLISSATTSGKTSLEGIYTVKLANPVNLAKNETFAIVIDKKTSPGTPVKVVADCSSSSYWYNFVASSKSGESFYYSGDSWNDFGEENDSNIRIKAFTNTVSKPKVAVTSISLTDTEKLSIDIDDTTSLLASTLPLNASNHRVKWTSSNPEVVSVSKQGLVTANNEGSAIITATSESNNISASIEITVKVPISKFFFDTNNTLGLKPGQTIQVPYIVEPANASYKVQWETSDSDVAVVDSNGKVTAKGLGSCYIIMRHPLYSTWYATKYINVTSDGTIDNTAQKLIYLEDCQGQITPFYYTYNGTAFKSKLTSLKYNSLDVLAKYPDCFAISYSDNIKAGTGKMTISSKKGNRFLTGKKVFEFTIHKASQDNSCTLPVNGIFVGQKYKLKITNVHGPIYSNVSDESVLTIDKNLVLTAKKAGFATVILQAKGDDCYNAGTKIKLHITVSPAQKAPENFTAKSTSKGIELSWKPAATCSKLTVYRNGKAIKTLTKTATKYLDKSAKVGQKYSYYVTAYYSGNNKTLKSKAITLYRLNPVSKTKFVACGRKKVKISWAKQSNVSGYQIQYCLSNKFSSGVKSLSVNSSKASSKSITTSKKGTTYFRIRSFKNYGGQKYYGPWSTITRLKVK